VVERAVVPLDRGASMSMQKWKQRARALKEETYAVYLACRHPRTPWYARVVGACVVAYLFSPIDLIPDPIPVLGYLDDLVIVPLGIGAVRKMIPAAVMAECREKAQGMMAQGKGKPKNWIAAAVIIAVWLALVVVAVELVVGVLRH
jgi:uncharacterized membrane protein YkvA (DUF1232 family)